MKIPVLGATIDERFLRHRLKSTSLAGQVGIVLATGLWFYRHFRDHIWSWDLFAVIATMALVKVAAVVWYRLHD
jgi:hypothetical protein